MSNIFVGTAPKKSKAALKLELEALIDNPDGRYDLATVRLFVNDVQPNGDQVLATFTEATFTGYAASSAIVWGAVFIDEAGRAVVMGGSKQFTGGDAADPETVYGYMVVNAAGTGLLWAERLPAPLTMIPATDAVIIVPAIVHGQAAAMSA